MIGKFFKIIYYFVIAALVSVALLLIISAFPVAGNIKVLTVLSGSMEPAIHTGSVVVVMPEKSYKTGDVITFGPNTRTEIPTTHRIVDQKVESGQMIYKTKGDANNSADTKEVKESEIIGKVLFSVPYAGYAVSSAKKPIGFMLVILVPALAIIVDEVRKVIKEAKKLKKVQKNESSENITKEN